MDNPAEADIGAALAARDFAVESFGAALRIANVTSEAEQRPYFTYNGLVSHQVTLIPGDGIGPEVSSAARRAVDATGVSIDWEIVELNEKAILKAGTSLPQDVLDSLERTRVGLKGPVTTPIGGGFSSVNVALRKKLDLYANVRPVRSLPGVATRFADVKIDMVIFRENTEDLYSGLEHEVVKDVVTSLKVITRVASIKIAEYAFQYANRLGRKKVAAIHKANIMKLADGLFLRCCREVAAKFPHIEYKELIVDNASMQLVMRPEVFDVLLLPNLYGDIVSDLAAGLVGGLGIVPGANMGEHHAVFEAVHGSAPDIAGKGIANPTAMMLSSVMMLIHLEELEAAKRLQTAIEKVYANRTALTGDVGGQASTVQFTDGVIQAISAGS
jgi:isocitrate dehydrogenase (NAD+)